MKPPLQDATRLSGGGSHKYILEGVERGYPLIVASAKGFLGKKGYVVFLEEFFSESDANFVPWGFPPFGNPHYNYEENED